MKSADSHVPFGDIKTVDLAVLSSYRLMHNYKVMPDPTKI
jgi:hypothetical protein